MYFFCLISLYFFCPLRVTDFYELKLHQRGLYKCKNYQIQGEKTSLGHLYTRYAPQSFSLRSNDRGSPRRFAPRLAGAPLEKIAYLSTKSTTTFSRIVCLRYCIFASTSISILNMSNDRQVLQSCFSLFPSKIDGVIGLILHYRARPFVNRGLKKSQW